MEDAMVRWMMTLSYAEMVALRVALVAGMGLGAWVFVVGIRRMIRDVKQAKREGRI